MSGPEFVSFAEGEARLTWLGLVEAIRAGHRMPRAQIADSFLYQGDNTLLNRAAWIDGLGLAVKTVTVAPGNAAHGLPPINGAVSLYDDATLQLDALVDFHLVTKWKTAADSLTAALALAPPQADTILIVGAGTVAQSLHQAYSAGFPGARFLLWNRTADKARALAAELPRAEAVTDLAQAVALADIVSCATMATQPVLRGEWLRPGQHIDLIGAYRPDMREADDTALRRGRLFVDNRDTTLDHIGELMIPLASGVIRREDVIADLYQPDAFVRAPQDITLFKNGGGAHLDLMTARHVLARWRDGRT
ncbi:MAG: ornithine cyclodeaminase [Roseivivax sp.]|nr:ornithine cyclodeaminase [Roseivivax sp.]